MSCGVGCRCGSCCGSASCRLAATALIQPLAWEPPYAMGEAQEMAKRLKKKKKKKKNYLPLATPSRGVCSTFAPLFGASAPAKMGVREAQEAQIHPQ